MASLSSTLLSLLLTLTLLICTFCPSNAARNARASASSASPNPVLSNRYLNLTFSSTDFSLQSISSNLHSPPYPFLSSPCFNWWQGTVITNTSHYPISSASPSALLTFHHPTSSSLSLLYTNFSLPNSLGTVNLNIFISLPPADQTASFHLSINGWSTTEPVGLWDWTWSIGPLRPSPPDSTEFDDTFILLNSYGALYRRPLKVATGRIDEVYPSAGATYQFLAYYHETPSPSFPPQYPGLYFGSHDRTNSRKTFAYIPSPSSLTLSVTVTPPNPTSPHPSLFLPFPFTLGVFAGDWWDAAQIYREFALQSPWTRRTIGEREDWPKWLVDSHLWLNTGWQYHDVFNATQGDPLVVVDRVRQIFDRFNLPKSFMSLHWYVFQESNKFDAYYPVYFPAKQNFTEAVATIQNLGVNVFPYINGRIMDVDLPKWKEDNASNYAAKSQPPQLITNLSLYYEDYGNDVKQAAMCPATAYWQQTYATVADTLVNTHGVRGIYIDQVGAASAQACYDPSHKHVLGDGTAWVDGYKGFFHQVRAKVGNNVSLVTESNAEPYMQLLNGYLTLTAFQHPVVGDSGLLVPVFPAVYGGYFMGFGAIFTVADLQDNPDGGFATILSAQFVHGAQLGWMSLGGTTDDPPMGLMDLLMSKKYDSEVEWMRRLVLTRARVVDWFTYGREMRTPVIDTDTDLPFPSSAHCELPSSQSTRFGRPQRPVCASPAASPPPFLTSAWLLPANGSSPASLLLLIVTPASTSSQSLSFSLNVTAFGFSSASAAGQFSVEQWQWDGTTTKLGQFDGRDVKWSAQMKGRGIVALVIKPIKGQKAEEKAHPSSHSASS